MALVAAAILHPSAVAKAMADKPSWPGRLLLLGGFVGGVEGVLQGDQVFAGFEGFEDGLLGLELFGGIGGGFDGQADAAVGLVNLDDAGGDFLADLENVFDFLGALLADLGDMPQAVNVVGY